MVTRTLTLGAEDAERWDVVVAEAGGDAAAVLRLQFDRYERTNAVERYRRLKAYDARRAREGHPADPEPQLQPQEPFVQRRVALPEDVAELLDHFVRELAGGDVVRLMHKVLVGRDELTRMRELNRLAAHVSRRARERGVLTDEQSAEAVRRVLRERAPEFDH